MSDVSDVSDMSDVSMDVFTLVNASGTEVRFIAYGGTIVSVRVPDRHGVLADVTPGFDTLDEYRHDGRFFGALIGRYANRIAGARFALDGVEYALPANDGVNHLHGGPRGFHRREWRVAPFRSEVGSSVPSTGAVLYCRSSAGDEGYPGTLVTRVTYTLADDDTFTIDYSAVSDAPTPVNLTQHAYFNLGGHDAGDVLGHELFLNAVAFTPVDRSLIPTGEIRPVQETSFDFTTPRQIGAAMAAGDEQLGIGGGFDHNFVLDGRVPGEATLAARVHDPASGRTLEILTTEPGIQFYSGNGLAGGPPGKGGCRYSRYDAFALETQHFPDSPNQPRFPSTIVRPGGEYRSTTVWRFSAR